MLFIALRCREAPPGSAQHRIFDPDVYVPVALHCIAVSLGVVL